VPRSRKKRGLTAEEWNSRYPAGTRVRFQPVRGVNEFEERVTRSEAWDLCGTPVVLLEGRGGGCAIDHMTALP